ncbi:MAG TPA: hypothetical protein VGM84_05125 [Steroidobacteraceae bacterium]
MREIIESRLQDHRSELGRLQERMDREMSGEILRRDGMTLRYLHGQASLHSRVIEELELLLAYARNHGQ